jgi:hypothetical protein
MLPRVFRRAVIRMTGPARPAVGWVTLRVGAMVGSPFGSSAALRAEDVELAE